MKKLIVIGLVLFCGCNKKYDVYEMPKDAYINLNENNFIVFEEHNSNELIKDSNVEILSNKKLDTNTIGKHKYTIDYKYKKRSYKYDIEYEVIDTTKPVFISSLSRVNVEINKDENFCDRISYGDNYDSKVNCKVEGFIDFTKIGTYNLEFVLKDSSNNENRKNFIVNVVEKIDKKNTTSTPQYLYINDIMKYKNDNTSIGIDVSRWQGNIDFQKVKDAGIEFVIIRMGYQKNLNDEYQLDPKFNEYYKAAKEVGLKVSVYVYTVALNELDGIKCANWVLKNLNGDKLDLPIAFDWENWKDFKDYNTSIHDLSHGYLAFEKELKKHGYDSILYSSKYYLENVWLDYDKSNIWLANYTSKTDYQGAYMLWQMTNMAKINGITDNTVDIDILYKKN